MSEQNTHTNNNVGAAREAPNQYKPGYKETKCGWIPEDWECVKLGYVCKNIADGTHQTPEYVDEGIPFYSVENVTNDNFTDTKYIAKRVFEDISEKRIPKKNDILMTRIGTVGKTAMVKTDTKSSIYVSLALLKIKKEFNQKYIYSFTKSNLFRKLVLRRSLTNAIPMKINMKDVGKVPIPLPPKNEQEKIADILGTWDKAIEQVEQLIEAKEKLKKGLMQQLLTGRMRFPEFGKPVKEKGEIPEGWREVKLGDLGVLKGSTVDKIIREEEKMVRLINYMDVYKNDYLSNKDHYMEVSTSKSKLGRFNLIQGDVLFTPSSETPDDIAKSALIQENIHNAVYSYHLVRMRFNNMYSVYNKFKMVMFKSSDFYKQMFERATGATRYTLNMDDFKSAKIYFPMSTEEQRRIAQIILTILEEIKLLNNLRKYNKTQKKGLMQKLLTGEIRVIDN